MLKSITTMAVATAVTLAVTLFVTVGQTPLVQAAPPPGTPAPTLIDQEGNFFVGGTLNPNGRISGQMYVEFQIPHVQKHQYPLVFIHGGGQIGPFFWTTPDGRPGWAQYFLRLGYPVYVVDVPARGRSSYNSQLGALSDPTDVLTAQRLFAAPERYNLWPAAALHTQWVGPAVPGDPTFDQFMDAQAAALADSLGGQEALTSKALIALLDRIGPAILVPHSQATFATWIAIDQRPNLVKALVDLEGGGPPVKFGPPLIVPGLPLPYGLTVNPITYSPPVSDPSQLQFVQTPITDRYVQSCLLQVPPARTLPNLQKVPTLMLSSEAGYNTEWDPCTNAYLDQAGVAHSWVRLPDIGIHGNAHFDFIEANSDQVAGVVSGWLKLAGL
jgi:pimeloyl-ACP methyl ester carboxylesterase